MPLPRRAEVVVVGAGLAGLSAATRLATAGRDVLVLDAAEHAGGRLATERVDGFVVDRGFQVLNTGYPRAPDLHLAARRLRRVRAARRRPRPGGARPRLVLAGRRGPGGGPALPAGRPAPPPHGRTGHAARAD